MGEKDNLSERIGLCFKPNDVRCVAGVELDEEIVYRTAKAFVFFLKAKEIILGHDMRISSLKLKKAFVKGALEQGVKVIDIGEIDSPGLYFASGFFKKPAAMITASHNPAKYNGIKLTKENATPIGKNSGLKKIKTFVEKNKFPKVKTKGKIVRKNIFSEYRNHVRSFVDSGKIGNLKVVIDGGNGMTGRVIPKIYDGLKVKVVRLDFKLDGNFPNHEANPAKPENIKDLRRVVVKKKADLGIAFDGDMDRVFFVDEKGRAVSASVIAALIAKHLCLKHKEKIVYNVVMLKVVSEIIMEYGGVSIREKVGHSFIKSRMKKEKAVFGCEHSAHYYYKNNFYVDSGIITSLKILEIASLAEQKGKKFSEILREFQVYSQTPEISVKVKDKEMILRKVEKRYKKIARRVDKMDGLTLEFDDWWFNVRASNTEPLLRINAEARDKKILKGKLNDLIKIIK